MRGTLAGLGLLLAAQSCAPQPEVGVAGVYVESAPSPAQVEVLGAAPGAEMVWMSGRWSWVGGNYVWVPGQWVEAAPGYSAWVPGRWIHTRRGWYFVEGHWR
jgi:hypothetical protein